MQTDRVIMFDLGGVLVENNGKAGLAAMLPFPINDHELWRRWLSSPTVRQFERGKISSDTFAKAFVDEWQIKLEPSAFIEAFAKWPTHLFAGAEDLLRRLKGGHHLACMSNTNSIHWERFPTLRSLFDSCFLSHETGLVKPDREAFENALKVLGKKPEVVYFFDDLLLNVNAARELGINAFQTETFSAIEPILRSERLFG
jgi:putative hydrolase of the HAD superfamily